MNRENPRALRISDFNYELPEDRIAKRPVSQRHESKLLVFKNKAIEIDSFSGISGRLDRGDCLVFNESKVIRARLPMAKESGAGLEVFCLHPSRGVSPEVALASGSGSRWMCMVKGLKKWKSGPLTLPISSLGIDLTAWKGSIREGEAMEVEFQWNCPNLSFAQVLEAAGKVPLPPYLKREEEISDVERYQTVYARIPGSVAAPTAGLHFTPELLQRLSEKSVDLLKVSLHVSAGTFLPVKADTMGEHDMHREVAEVSLRTVEALGQTTGRLISVGTTSLRTLESLFWLAREWQQTGVIPAEVGQWNHEENGPTFREMMLWLGQKMASAEMKSIRFSTKIIITPGYEVRSAEGLVTNFHQPSSTLLLLVASFVGEDWKRIYDFALANEFRFLSFGDSSLLWRE